MKTRNKRMQKKFITLLITVIKQYIIKVYTSLYAYGNWTKHSIRVVILLKQPTGSYKYLTPIRNS